MAPLPRLSDGGRRASSGQICPSNRRKTLICLIAAASTYVGCHMVPMDVAAPPVANLGASPARTAQLETGRLIFTSSHKCARCHRPKPIVDYSPAFWTESIMPRMAKKAKLSEVEEKYLMAYILTAHDAIPHRPPTR
jgi:hypothetical protein